MTRRRVVIAITFIALVIAVVAAVTLRGGKTETGTTASPTKSVQSAPAVARSTPITLRIPAIGMSGGLTVAALNKDGTVETPTDYHQAAWYRLGPAPGEQGSAVILGHVDDYRGPAVFFKLKDLKSGDMVDVSMVNGVTAHFKVTEVKSYLKSEFPAEQVYGSRGGSMLQLVTCGGEFDPQARRYLSNVVAYTTLVSTEKT